jgi:tetratricopeptide (TPR) repeat protein
MSQRYDAAVADASEVLRVDAGNVKALYRRSLALEALGMQQLSEGFGDSGPAEGYLAQAVRDADAALALETGSNKALQELRTRLIDAIAKRDAWNTTKSKVAPSASSTKAAVGIEGEEDSVEMVVEAARARALGHLQEGRCAEAVAGLQDALARPPLRGLPTIEALRPLLLLLLSSHRSMGDHEGTLACADRILGFEEGNVRALICRAQANLAMVSCAYMF